MTRRAGSRLAAIALMSASSCVPPGGAAAGDRAAGRTGVDAARELDQEGVRSFLDGRYVDAIAYFRAAYRLGGPPSELWNIVRSREKLDDGEGAAAIIDEYLTMKDLAPHDRAEAEREAQALRARTSVLTVTTVPPGAAVLVDGRQSPGVTPLSVDVRSGSHSIVVRRDGYSPGDETVVARFGRAVIVSLDLARSEK